MGSKKPFLKPVNLLVASLLATTAGAAQAYVPELPAATEGAKISTQDLLLQPAGEDGTTPLGHRSHSSHSSHASHASHHSHYSGFMGQ